jgi:hypothetical protein
VWRRGRGRTGWHQSVDAGLPFAYQVDPQAVADLRAYFDSFWDQSLAAFRAAAEQPREDS